MRYMMIIKASPDYEAGRPPMEIRPMFDPANGGCSPS